MNIILKRNIDMCKGESVVDLDIGKAIYVRRKMIGITQAELAEGIIDISNLSKLESGRQIATPENLELLLERLGVNEPGLLEKPLGKNEIKMAEIKKEISNAIFDNRRDDAQAAISTCENDPDCTGLWKSKFFKPTKDDRSFFGKSQRTTHTIIHLRCAHIVYNLKIADFPSKINLSYDYYCTLSVVIPEHD